MKFAGRSSFKRTVSITLSYPDTGPDGAPITSKMTLQIRPLPFDFGDTMAKRMPPPTIPSRPTIVNGRPLRDDNQRPVIAPDPNDASYLAEKAIYDRRTGTASIVHAVDDPSVSFDAKRPGDDASGEEWIAYYDAVHAELSAAAFPAGLFRQLVVEIGVASGVTKESVRDGMRDFLPETGPTSKPETQSGSSSNPPLVSASPTSSS